MLPRRPSPLSLLPALPPTRRVPPLSITTSTLLLPATSSSPSTMVLPPALLTWPKVHFRLLLARQPSTLFLMARLRLRSSMLCRCRMRIKVAMTSWDVINLECQRLPSLLKARWNTASTVTRSLLVPTKHCALLPPHLPPTPLFIRRQLPPQLTMS